MQCRELWPCSFVGLTAKFYAAKKRCEQAVVERDLARQECERLRAVINTPHHVAVFDDFGWGLEHSLDCRLAQTMTTCAFNDAMTAFGQAIEDPEALISQGRWAITSINEHGHPDLVPEFQA